MINNNSVNKKKFKLLFFLLIPSLLRTNFAFHNTLFRFSILDIIIMLFLIFAILKYFTINKYIFFYINLLFFISVWGIYQGTTEFKFVIEQIINIFIYFSFFWLLFKFYNFNLDIIFTAYVKLAIIVAILGIIQFFGYLIKTKFLYNYSFLYLAAGHIRTSNLFGIEIIRVNSILTEPSFLGYLLSPLCFFSIYNIINKKNLYFNRKVSLLFIFTCIFSQSTIAIFGLVLSIIFVLFLKYKDIKKVWALTIIIIVCFLIYLFITPVNERVTDILKGLTNFSPSIIIRLGTSAFSLLNNGFVALKNFINNPIIGGGLGSHFLLSSKIGYIHASGLELINAHGANSMLLRILSETGLIGIFICFKFLTKFYISKKCNTNSSQKYLLLNRSSLIYILLIGIRMGNFRFQFFPLMIFLYYYSFKNLEIHEKSTINSR